MTEQIEEEDGQENKGILSFLDMDEIAGFPIKEWNTRQFCKLYPNLREVCTYLLDHGATLDNLSEFVQDNVPVLIDALIPSIPALITVSCPSKTDEQFDALAWPAAIQIAVALVKKNVEHLTDFFEKIPA